VGAEWKGLKELDVSVDFYVNPMLRTVELTPFADETLTGGGGEEPDPGPPPPDPGPRESPRLRRQARQDEEPLQRPELPDLSSRGLAYGMEVLLRRPLGGNWFGWLSYTLQRSTRRTRFIRHEARRNEAGEVLEVVEGGEQMKDLPFVFDQTHVLNLVISYKFSNNITLGGVLHFNTGRPEAGVLGSQTQVEDVYRDVGLNRRVPSWREVDRDQVDRLPAFFRFDMRVSRAWAFDTFTLEAYLDMLNVTISREVVGFDYVGGFPPGSPLEKNPVGLPIVLPIMGMKGRY
jgi:hypothetical protein